jgi:peptide/nickel transport system substrate-binding protein
MSYLTPLRFLSLLVLFAISLSCGAPPPSNNSSANTGVAPRTAGVPGGSVAYRISAPPNTLNYLVATTEPSILISLYLMNSRPIEFDHSTQGYRAALAETWTLGPDRQTLDVKLRDGLKFSDGKPLTTADLVFTLEAMYDEKTRARYKGH